MYSSRKYQRSGCSWSSQHELIGRMNSVLVEGRLNNILSHCGILKSHIHVTFLYKNRTDILLNRNGDLFRNNRWFMWNVMVIA